MLDISPFLPSEEKKIESFRGSFVSVTSNDDIQYNGVLHQINLQEATLCIKNVTRCAKDEIQRDDLQILPQTNTNYRSQLPLSNEFYDHMVFHASDIKDLNIISQAKQSESIIGHFVSVITTENLTVMEVRGGEGGDASDHAINLVIQLTSDSEISWQVALSSFLINVHTKEFTIKLHFTGLSL
ncbi:unnamed protein product [Arabis nemorensis]|uniref:Lsm14-like N-terminal domain-containing protein n=1 Tax=Arabis nemorensis TaxID=586526 RepID=A0A565CFU9_9BRAS|nr:unnamed protein product [Arabis nemorensis]